MASPANPVDTGHTRILDINEVKRRLSCGRSSVYRLEKKGILHRAKQLEGCRTAGWMEDEVDAVVESRRPDRQPVPTTKTGPANSRGGRSAEKAIAPATRSMQPPMVRDEGRSELTPTTLRVMGKVVYLHQPSGRLLMEIGKLSAVGPGLRLTPSAIVGTKVGEDD